MYIASGAILPYQVGTAAEIGYIWSVASFVFVFMMVGVWFVIRNLAWKYSMFLRVGVIVVLLGLLLWLELMCQNLPAGSVTLEDGRTIDWETQLQMLLLLIGTYVPTAVAGIAGVIIASYIPQKLKLMWLRKMLGRE